MAGSKCVSVASGSTSSSTEILSSDSKEVVSSMGKEVKLCEVSTTQVAEFATSSSLIIPPASPHDAAGRAG